MFEAWFDTPTVLRWSVCQSSSETKLKKMLEFCACMKNEGFNHRVCQRMGRLGWIQGSNFFTCMKNEA